jgi:hypothetical protein
MLQENSWLLRLRTFLTKSSSFLEYNILYFIESHPTFRRNMSPSSAQALLAACFVLVSCLSYFLTVKMEETFSSEMWFTFSGLYGIIYPRYNDFITIDVRTSNPIRSSIFDDLRFKLSVSSWLSKAVHIRVKTMHLTVDSNKNKLRGISPQASYTDRATAACRRN